MCDLFDLPAGKFGLQASSLADQTLTIFKSLKDSIKFGTR